MAKYSALILIFTLSVCWSVASARPRLDKSEIEPTVEALILYFKATHRDIKEEDIEKLRKDIKHSLLNFGEYKKNASDRMIEVSPPEYRPALKLAYDRILKEDEEDTAQDFLRVAKQTFKEVTGLDYDKRAYEYQMQNF